jgi:hypothetical protein
VEFPAALTHIVLAWYPYIHAIESDGGDGTVSPSDRVFRRECITWPRLRASVQILLHGWEAPKLQQLY